MKKSPKTSVVDATLVIPWPSAREPGSPREGGVTFRPAAARIRLYSRFDQRGQPKELYVTPSLPALSTAKPSFFRSQQHGRSTSQNVSDSALR